MAGAVNSPINYMYNVSLLQQPLKPMLVLLKTKLRVKIYSYALSIQ